jgi:hypothetical protein
MLVLHASSSLLRFLPFCAFYACGFLFLSSPFSGLLFGLRKSLLTSAPIPLRFSQVMYPFFMPLSNEPVVFFHYDCSNHWLLRCHSKASASVLFRKLEGMKPQLRSHSSRSSSRVAVTMQAQSTEDTVDSVIKVCCDQISMLLIIFSNILDYLISFMSTCFHM